MKQSIDFIGKGIDQAGGIAKHNDRVKGFNFGNEKIHHDLSKDNVVFVESRLPEMSKRIRKLGSTNKIAGGLRSNSKTFTGFVIQSGSKEQHLDREDAIKYFEESLAFLEDKFGKENIGQAVAHFDETTPHLHVLVSHLKSDPVKGKFYCSAKQAWGYAGLTPTQVRQKAKDFSQEFYNSVSKNYGFEEPSKELGTRGKQTKREWLKTERLRVLENSKATKPTGTVPLKEFDALVDDYNLLLDENERLEKKLERVKQREQENTKGRSR